MLGKLIKAALAVTAVVIVVNAIPDIRRYVRMSRM